MKKKIALISFIMALFACLLVISVGATAINKDTTVTLSGSFTDVNNNAVTEIKLYDNDGDALIWYLNTDGKLVSAKAASLVTVDSEGVISFTNDYSIFYKNHPAKAAIAVNLRDNVKVSGTNTNFDGQIKHFDTSKGIAADTNLASTGFQFGSYNFSEGVIQYFYFPTSTNSIVKRMFQGTPIKVADFEPGTNLNQMGWLAFYGASKLTKIYIPNDLAIFPGACSEGLFQNCTSLSEVTFEENSTLWDAGASTFYGCLSLKELYLPNSVRTLGSEFARSSGLEIFSFGAGFEYITRRDPNKDPDDSHIWVFYSTRLKKVYMPATFAILDDSYAFDDYVSQDERLDTFDRIFANAGSFTLYFTGTEEEINKLKTRFSYTYENSSIVSALNKIYSYDEYIEEGSPSGSCAVYNYNKCDAFYNEEHKMKESYVFTSFIDECYMQNSCTRCGVGEKGEVFAPIFTFNGYSMADDLSEICSSYMINLASLDKFNANKGEKVFNYGIIASANNNSPINSDGTFADKSVNIDLTNEKYVSAEFRLGGDWNDTNAKTALITMNIYVILADNKDAEKTVSYIYGDLDDNNNVITKCGSIADTVAYSQFVS